MSQSKTSVLIVFERDIRLDDMVPQRHDAGCRRVSELLKTSSSVKAPMHDGGHHPPRADTERRLYLPLSKNVNLSRDLGMRHRAGIGEQNSDAVVGHRVGETSSISVAIGEYAQAPPDAGNAVQASAGG